MRSLQCGLLLLFACTAEAPSGAFRCTVEPICPTGMTCGSDGVCRFSDAGTPDAPTADVIPDAVLDVDVPDGTDGTVPDADIPDADIPDPEFPFVEGFSASSAVAHNGGVLVLGARTSGAAASMLLRDSEEPVGFVQTRPNLTYTSAVYLGPNDALAVGHADDSPTGTSVLGTNGKSDVLISQFDNGVETKTRFVGTALSETANDVAADATHFYIVGQQDNNPALFVFGRDPTENHPQLVYRLPDEGAFFGVAQNTDFVVAVGSIKDGDTTNAIWVTFQKGSLQTDEDTPGTGHRLQVPSEYTDVAVTGSKHLVVGTLGTDGLYTEVTQTETDVLRVAGTPLLQIHPRGRFVGSRGGKMTLGILNLDGVSNIFELDSDAPTPSGRLADLFEDMPFVVSNYMNGIRVTGFDGSFEPECAMPLQMPMTQIVPIHVAYDVGPIDPQSLSIRVADGRSSFVPTESSRICQ